MISFDINDIYIYTQYVYIYETGYDLKLLWILAN